MSQPYWLPLGPICYSNWDFPGIFPRFRGPKTFCCGTGNAPAKANLSILPASSGKLVRFRSGTKRQLCGTMWHISGNCAVLSDPVPQFAPLCPAPSRPNRNGVRRKRVLIASLAPPSTGSAMQQTILAQGPQHALIPILWPLPFRASGQVIQEGTGGATQVHGLASLPLPRLGRKKQLP